MRRWQQRSGRAGETGHVRLRPAPVITAFAKPDQRMTVSVYPNETHVRDTNRVSLGLVFST